MRKANSNSWVRMTLAFAAVLVVAGPVLMLADPDPTYVPKSAVLIGPSSVAAGGSANYVLHVVFTNGATADFPPQTGATFTAVRGSITSGGAYTAPGTAGKDKISGSYTNPGGTTQATATASRIISNP